MPTSLALLRGFGGATLSQMMGIAYDEVLVKQRVFLGPGNSAFGKRLEFSPGFGKRLEFSPGETTWEILENMPLPWLT